LIIDTSALVAIATGEDSWQALRRAIANTQCTIPASALTEFQLVTQGRQDRVAAVARGLVVELLSTGLEVAAFEKRHADITAIARELYGKGNGKGGLLNFGDLMVYAVAKDRGEPLLCTGRDFCATDLDIHPASRLAP
jgi:ribonuclease VapC